MRWVTTTCFALILACLPLNLVQAASYSIPMDNSVAEINVPDSWNPNSSDLGVDAASPDRKLFFSIYATTNDDEKAALDEASTIAMNGDVLQIDIKSLDAKTVNIGDVLSHQYAYNATYNGKPGYLVINLAKTSTGGYLQIICWGTRKSFKMNYSGTAKIFKSLKLLGHTK